MDTQDANEPSKIPSATAGDQSIFSDLGNTARYEKSLKTARIYLYIIAGLQLVTGIYEYVTIDDKSLALFALAIDAGIGVLFLVFAIWSYKKPVAAFITALVTFAVVHVGLAFFDTSYIYKGIILKVLVVIALVKGIKDAKEVERLRSSLSVEND